MMYWPRDSPRRTHLPSVQRECRWRNRVWMDDNCVGGWCLSFHGETSSVLVWLHKPHTLIMMIDLKRLKRQLRSLFTLYGSTVRLPGPWLWSVAWYSGTDAQFPGTLSLTVSSLSFSLSRSLSLSLSSLSGSLLKHRSNLDSTVDSP